MFADILAADVKNTLKRYIQMYIVDQQGIH